MPFSNKSGFKSGFKSGSYGPILRFIWPCMSELGYKAFILFREYPWFRIVAVNLSENMKNADMLTSCDVTNMLGVSVNKSGKSRHIALGTSPPAVLAMERDRLDLARRPITRMMRIPIRRGQGAKVFHRHTGESFALPMVDVT